ncbi:hypothetical protein R1flu_026562 [Riccia fluitans]|uniref:CCHC-type domain-containing protein n=1 Tax=Riccia fluitans TaxID=41844 RepID=A0ABD1XG99_9MARC
MVEIEADPPDYLVIEMPWGAKIVQEVKYLDSQNKCFRCQKPGHQAKFCPMNGSSAGTETEGKEHRNPSPEQPQKQMANENDGFTPVSSKHTSKEPAHGHTAPTPTSTQNAFRALDTEDDQKPPQASTGVAPSSPPTLKQGFASPAPAPSLTTPPKLVKQNL